MSGKSLDLIKPTPEDSLVAKINKGLIEKKQEKTSRLIAEREYKLEQTNRRRESNIHRQKELLTELIQDLSFKNLGLNVHNLSEAERLVLSRYILRKAFPMAILQGISLMTLPPALISGLIYLCITGGPPAIVASAFISIAVSAVSLMTWSENHWRTPWFIKALKSLRYVYTYLQLKRKINKEDFEHIFIRWCR